MGSQAQVERVTVKVGERFPLEYHDEVLLAEPLQPGSDQIVLMVLRRGL